MTNPVNKPLLDAKINVGETLKVNLKIGGNSAKAGDGQNRSAITSLNHNYTKNPNNARPEATAHDANQPPNANAKPKGKADAPPANQRQDEDNNGNNRGNRSNRQNVQKGDDATQIQTRARGEKGGDNNASQQGILNGRGHQKTEKQNPPLIINPNENQGNQNGKPAKTPPPIVILPQDHGEHHDAPRQNFPTIFTSQNTNQTNTRGNNYPLFGTNYSVAQNLSSFSFKNYTLCSAFAA